ncbi:DUF2306 domain-containing protein [Nocardia sp. CDC159]|uniref:DUF2306 domain-containing protein n=1 Tax=Nocardia pulmonis TaxID=2951408 RepID=A0A9X2IXH8_9NOCA|nr:MULTISPECIES: DUF2306 domain-containing protein [Nocardia]MCM6773875.1 DUF2306 domain-containing protein [Nocardia pulmonis]MCM6786762.1 DUF2306 domain-containing protein [Nocardia sp. CDC159]
MTDTATSPASSPTRPPTPDPRRERWWRRPWVVPLGFVVFAFLAFSVPPYLTFDPDRARVPAPPDFAPHYPLLVAHVLFGSVAMVTCCLQVWPWFRQRRPRAHRISGRIYVFGGVLPAGVSALGIGAFSPFGPVARVSNVMLALLWLTCTVIGFRMARRRRYADHRRWMIRSFALTLSIIGNRLWGAIVLIVLSTADPALPQERLTEVTAGIGTWLGWTIALLVAEWWVVERGRGARRRVA